MRSICSLTFYTDSSKCFIVTLASILCFSISLTCGCLSKNSWITKETAVFAMAAVSAPLSPSVSSESLSKSTCWGSVPSTIIGISAALIF